MLLQCQRCNKLDRICRSADQGTDVMTTIVRKCIAENVHAALAPEQILSYGVVAGGREVTVGDGWHDLLKLKRS